MEKYIRINELNEAEDNEEICALYPSPDENRSGYKTDEHMINAEKDAKEGKCKLLVWRKVDKQYKLTESDINELVSDYKAYVKRFNMCPSSENRKWEAYGHAEAIKKVFNLIGYNMDELPTYKIIDKELEWDNK